MSPPPVLLGPTMALAPETPCRMRPVSFEDKQTPPPLPFEMQGNSDGFHQFQIGQLGVVSEESGASAAPEFNPGGYH
ncbi:PGIC1-A [Symbiodinium pilosum]|uniref:PGIC1-A protein n=1 Tax=Symbiodinium pilosum TaxID=2952 RepID=A0A812YCS9_SYMPI|nr:PGIC1-A [Symbiodinium pilosum]